MRLLESSTRRTIAYVVICMVLAYCADLLVFHLRASRGSGLASVTVEQYMQVTMKGNKVEFNYIGTADVNCTRSLFPQRVESAWTAPCWWRERHRKVWIEASTFSQPPRG